MSCKSLLLDYWLTLEGAPKNTFMEGATYYYSLYIAYLPLGNLGRYIAHSHYFSHVSCPLVKLAHGHAKLIHVATVNDGFNIGSMKKMEHAF